MVYGDKNQRLYSESAEYISRLTVKFQEGIDVTRLTS
jgi:hypothetical protein